MKLALSDDLALPLDAVTQAIGFLGRRGSGKTYAATKLAELMLAAQAQVVAIDPVGVWYGLRLGNGFPIPILGGLHGDIPLAPSAGALVADVVVDRSISVVLDVSQMLPSEQARFSTDFADRFFQRKKERPAACHMFLEEAQEFVPQNPMRGGLEPHMLHAFQRLVKLGRNFGIGVSLISQRPQEVSKKVMNMTELLLVFQMTGPQERKAVAGWVADKGVDVDIDALLPKLAVGAPHVWSPQWLGISRVIRIGEKRSLDASSTPKVGAARKTQTLTPIDLSELSSSMAETAAQMERDDPKRLRAANQWLTGRVRELEQQLARGPDDSVRRASEIMAKAMNDFDRLAPDFRAHVARTVETFNAIADGLRSAFSAAGLIAERTADASVRVTFGPPAPTKGVRPTSVKGERRLMAAIIQHGRCTREQLTVLTGYKRSSRDSYLQRLTSRGYVVSRDQHIEPTPSGRAAFPDVDLLPTGRALRDYWLERLPTGEATILDEVIRRYPRGIEREQLTELTGYKRSSRDSYLQRLRARQLITYSGSGVVAAQTLFAQDGV